MISLETPLELSVLFFLQLTIILGACRLMGSIARWLDQPAVVGEMIAGILLGPSLLGWLIPDLHRFIFQSDSMPILYALSQLGLTLYMFVIGTEFHMEHFQRHGSSAISISMTGIIVPFIAGALIAVWLYGQGGFFPEGTQWLEAVLFIGASMSITAFPMLARIIDENQLVGTSMGTLSLAAAAVDDVVAWCILALILSISSHDWLAPIIAVVGGIGYTVVVLTMLKPCLQSVLAVDGKLGEIRGNSLLFVLSIVMLGACLSNAIGIHSVFGAFLIGCAVPRGRIADSLRRQIEPITISLLVPLFFTYTGLKTRFDLVCTPWLLLVALVVIVSASISKGVACWGAARLSGESQANAMGIGCLMNARGMMGLILLSIGKDKGIVGPELFTILVLMALVTTLATTPAFHWIRRRYSIETTIGSDAT